MSQNIKPKLTHFDNSGQAHMVDVGDKPESKRIAIASGKISMLPATLKLIQQGDAKKGDVLGVARIAAIQASKKTSDLIPLCHPTCSLTKVTITFEIDEKTYLHHLHRHLRDYRQNRGGDGSAHRREYWLAYDL